MPEKSKAIVCITSKRGDLGNRLISCRLRFSSNRRCPSKFDACDRNTLPGSSEKVSVFVFIKHENLQQKKNWFKLRHVAKFMSAAYTEKMSGLISVHKPILPLSDYRLQHILPTIMSRYQLPLRSGYHPSPVTTFDTSSSVTGNKSCSRKTKCTMKCSVPG